DRLLDPLGMRRVPMQEQRNRSHEPQLFRPSQNWVLINMTVVADFVFGDAHAANDHPRRKAVPAKECTPVICTDVFHHARDVMPTLPRVLAQKLTGFNGG